MDRNRSVTLARVPVLTAICLLWGSDQVRAQTNTLQSRDATALLQRRAARVTNEQRQAAADRAAAAWAEAVLKNVLENTGPGPAASLAAPLPAMLAVPGPGGTPNYFGPEPNWAYSPQPTITPTGVTGGIRKFADRLPGLTPAGANQLGQYIPVAVPDTTTFPGSDYYEIGLVEYTEKMHSDLPPTRLRGYVQLNDPAHPATRDATGTILTWPQPRYLGPLIVANSYDPAQPAGAGGNGKPVRIKFVNLLPTGAGGDLFIPVDTSEMGAGMGPDGMTMYTQNRATLHLHGGRSPWISDGTPHQWVTPAGESTPYPKGVSAQNVPDMWFDPVTHNPVLAGTPGATNDPGPGAMTFYYTNQQSARLMFYHDHAYGITRLNVYAGQAAGYLLRDQTEQALIAAGTIPADEIPLIIQDKTFVDAATILTTDPTWNWGSTPPVPNTGDLWYPHVYMPNQNPNDPTGINAFGRWDYGPWFWPPWPATVPPITLPDGSVVPATPDVSMTMEAFQDTPLVNGTAYPTVTVQPKAYRFRILNAANDRFWNLQLYKASRLSIAVTNGGSGYAINPVVTISPPPVGGVQATATALVVGGVVNYIWVTNPGSGYTTAPTVTIADVPGGTGTGATAIAGIGLDDVKMVPATAGNWPPGWPAPDNRDGGFPDPAMAGPPIIQIGTEGGFLPAPVVFSGIPIGWDTDPKSITVGNIKEHNLFLGPAERADVIVDFSNYAGQTLILYNDAPAAVPARDIRLDYYTGHLDLTATGGTKTTIPGYGPNTRTIMQIKVAAGTPAPFNLAALQAAFASTATTQGVFARSQDPIIVPQDGYNSAYNAAFPNGTTAYARIADTSLTFTPMGSVTPVTLAFEAKSIAEEFEDTYGRMSGFLGVEVKFTNGMNQTTIFYGYKDPPTEIIRNGETQIWKITHNGVDTHPVHFHLFDVQLINRVDWAGVVKPPEPNELGWKETVRMNPLEDCIVALRPIAPALPFAVPDSVRPLDPTMPIGSPVGFKNVDPQGNPITVTNQLTNFHWEYVWHCHILSHEEMDMMRPMSFIVGNPCPYDLDNSGAVGVGDFSLFAPCWTRTTADPLWGVYNCGQADFDHNGAVDVGDFSFFATGWLKTCGDPTIVYPP